MKYCSRYARHEIEEVVRACTWKDFGGIGEEMIGKFKNRWVHAMNEQCGMCYGAVSAAYRKVIKEEIDEAVFRANIALLNKELG